MTRLLIIDDHPMTCAGLKSLLQACYPSAVIDTLHTVQTPALGTLAAQADFLFLDMHLPGIDFPQVLETLAGHLNRVILISACPEPSAVALARGLGVRGLLLKNADVSAVLDGFQRIQSGELAFDDIDAAPHAWTRPLLTKRQDEVLKPLLAGLSNKQIARELDISEHTVKEHVTAILTAFGARNRLELVLACQTQGVY
jgi:two-component system, NarL family, nitrate/nitrite response regulator NarL